MIDPILLQGVILAAIFTGSALRILLPWYNKLQAAIKLAEEAGTEPVMPKFNNVYLVSAIIGTIITGVTTLTLFNGFIDQFKDADANALTGVFIVVLLAAIGGNDLTTRIVNTGISSTTKLGEKKKPKSDNTPSTEGSPVNTAK